MSTFEIVEKDEAEEIAKYLEGFLESPADALLIRKMAAENAALKEEIERLKKQLDNRKEDYSFLMDKYDKSAREAIHLKDRVAELERALALMLKVHDLSDSPDGDVTRIARAALKEPANEG